jgi:hypothetical protein
VATTRPRHLEAWRRVYTAAREEWLRKSGRDSPIALGNDSGDPDHIDWVAYYKNHGYQINAPGGCCPGGACRRINYAPVLVRPAMQWAVPGR